MNRKTKLIALAFFCAAMLASRCALGAGSSDRLKPEDAAFLKYLNNAGPSAPTADSDSPFRDISPNHWAYQAVVYLSNKGLLAGSTDDLFHGDRPVTRYELAVILQKMMTNYRAYQETGELPAQTVAELPEEEGKSAKAEPAAAAPKRSTVKTADGFYRKGPKAIGEPEKEEKKASSKSKKGEDGEEDEDSGEKNDEVKVKSPILKKLVKKHKDWELTEKEVTLFEELYEWVQDEMKEKEKNTKKLIGDVKKLAGGNEQDIRRLKDEDARYRVTGSGWFKFNSSSDQPPFKKPEDAHPTSYVVDGNVDYGVSIKALRSEDLSISGCGVASCGDPTFNYHDLTMAPGKNVHMRELVFGQTSVAYSFLTTFGGPSHFRGGKTELQFNKYTVKMMLGRSQLYDGDHYQMDADMEYGASLSVPLFGNQESLFSISRFLVTQNKEDQKNYRYSDFGYDANLTCASLPYGDILFNSDASKSVTCTPPTKNSVSDIFVKYPVPSFSKGARAFVTIDYAHSTFNRDAFNMEIDDAEKKENNVAVYSTKYAPEDMYESGGGPAWRPIASQNQRGEALLAVLDYTKGPIRVTAAGYGRLGCSFNSRFLGFAGFDLSSLTGSLGGLPLSLQCLEIFPLVATYDNYSKRKYRYTIQLVKGNEYKPLKFDLAKLPSAFSKVSLGNALNNRGSNLLLNALYLSQKYEYQVSNGFSVSGKYDYTTAKLGPGCLDATMVVLTDATGAVIDKKVGNGVADCSEAAIARNEGDANVNINYKTKKQEYTLYYRASQDADYNMSYTIERSTLSGAIGTIEADTIADPGNTTYEIEHKLNYRVNTISSIEFRWKRTFGKEGYESFDPGIMVQDHNELELLYKTSF